MRSEYSQLLAYARTEKATSRARLCLLASLGLGAVGLPRHRACESERSRAGGCLPLSRGCLPLSRGRSVQQPRYRTGLPVPRELPPGPVRSGGAGAGPSSPRMPGAEAQARPRVVAAGRAGPGLPGGSPAAAGAGPGDPPAAGSPREAAQVGPERRSWGGRREGPRDGRAVRGEVTGPSAACLASLRREGNFVTPAAVSPAPGGYGRAEPAQQLAWEALQRCWTSPRCGCLAPEGTVCVLASQTELPFANESRSGSFISSNPWGRA